MKDSSLFGWFGNISIAKKLYFTVGIMAALICVELFALFFAMSTLSSVRAYVGGEGLWSKAQKDAVHQLFKYAASHNEKDYLLFQKFMAVPMGDSKTRIELAKAKPDWEVARQGFLEGRNHPDDIDGMIKLFRRFNKISYIHKAIEYWNAAEIIAMQLIPIGQKLHDEINSANVSDEKIKQILSEIDPINDKVTVLEDGFSYTLGEGARWLERLVLRLLFIIALTVEITGLLLAISVSRSIQKGIAEIIAAAKSFAQGRLGVRAKVFSGDEIGELAHSFNQMSTQLEHTINELEFKNRELEQFVHVASHDLQEPLRTLSSFVELLERDYGKNLNPKEKEYMDFIVSSAHKMKYQIKALLDYSKIGTNQQRARVDCDKIMVELLSEMQGPIRANNIAITAEPLPMLMGYTDDIKLLFRNLLENAIKFRKPDIEPQIKIGASKTNNVWTFYVKDNGIGIDPQYLEKIFIIFQKLHLSTEYEGSGIGLAHCKKIVELHNGKIWAESEPGKGSTFYFTIPI